MGVGHIFAETAAIPMTMHNTAPEFTCSTRLQLLHVSMILE